MGNCALVSYRPETIEQAGKKGFLRRLADRFNAGKGKKKRGPALDILFEADDFRLYIIELPYNRSEFGKTGIKGINRLNAEIEEICRVHNIMNCYAAYSEDLVPGFCRKNEFNGELLYRCLFMDIMGMVCSRRGTGIGDMDIAVVAGNDMQELKVFLEMLAPTARYLSLLTDSREKVEEIVDGLYEEYGLCIGVSEDPGTGLSDADVIVNLGNLKGRVSKAGFRKNVIFINYGVMDNLVVPSSGRLIQGIVAGLPGKISARIEPMGFGANEFAEILLLNKINRTDAAGADIELFKAISGEFRRCGMVIRNLRGAYDVLRL